jgi:hypothetical protein
MRTRPRLSCAHSRMSTSLLSVLVTHQGWRDYLHVSLDSVGRYGCLMPTSQISCGRRQAARTGGKEGCSSNQHQGYTAGKYSRADPANREHTGTVGATLLLSFFVSLNVESAILDGLGPSASSKARRGVYIGLNSTSDFIRL